MEKILKPMPGYLALLLSLFLLVAGIWFATQIKEGGTVYVVGMLLSFLYPHSC
jgi:hypothetical protein